MKEPFLPADFNVDNADEVRRLFQQLADEEIPETNEALLDWLYRTDELDTRLSEVSARRYVATTLDTTDEKAAELSRYFNDNISPIAMEFSDVFNKKFMAHPCHGSLGKEYDLLIKRIMVSMELFNQDAIPLGMEESNEVQEYQKITGGLKVEFDGETYTPVQVSKFLQDTDRGLRERAWHAREDVLLAVKDKLDVSFDKLFAIRNKYAKMCGCSDYIEYVYKANMRDYGPSACYDFHNSVEKVVVPVLREMNKKSTKALGIESMRPWDTTVDFYGRAPLVPFTTGDELIEKVGQVFDSIHPKTREWYREMQATNAIDACSRIGKAPGGYNMSYPESRKSFIFMNAVGTDADLYVLFHESGHAFHNFAYSNIGLSNFRFAPAEFAEVASKSMELICMSHLKHVYGDDQEAINRSISDRIGSAIGTLQWVAMIDKFQHEVYSLPNHTAADRSRIWLDISNAYSSGVDWSGLEQYRARRWQNQLHIFEVPFYYIEYAIAQLGALQVWANYRKDPEKALNDLFYAESLGATVTVPEMFAAANIKFDFTIDTIEPLVQSLYEEWQKYNP